MEINDQTATAIGGGIVGVPAMWLFIQRFFVKSATNTAEQKGVDASIDVIDMLRQEVKRLGEINTELSEKLNDLQRENIKLRQEISDLHGTLSEMTEKLSVITLRSAERNGLPILDYDKRSGS